MPADGRIIEETSLEVIEASLTGESFPVKKDTLLLPEDVSLADRKNMVFMGTIVSHGNCLAVLTSYWTQHGVRQDFRHDPAKACRSAS